MTEEQKKRPEDVNSAAVYIGKIATRQINEKPVRRVVFEVVRK